MRDDGELDQGGSSGGGSVLQPLLPTSRILNGSRLASLPHSPPGVPGKRPHSGIGLDEPKARMLSSLLIIILA